jgi:DNA-binding IclR family transcriptional regulator
MPRPSPQTERVIAVINLLSTETTGCSMTEIARRIDASPSSCVHMLAALTAAGFVVRDPHDRRYHLGPALVAPGRVAARRHPSLATAREEMDWLSRTFGQPCFAFTRTRDHARLVHYTWDFRHPAPSIRVGETVPLTPPLGSVFVAWADEASVDEWLALDATMDSERAEHHRRQLAAIRAMGYVVEVQPPPPLLLDLSRLMDERASPRRDEQMRRALGGDHDLVLTDPEPDHTYAVSGIAAPVFDAHGGVELSLSLVGFRRPVRGDELGRYGESVRAAADRTTAALRAG